MTGADGADGTPAAASVRAGAAQSGLPAGPSFEIVTIFPEAVLAAGAIGVVGRAIREGRCDVRAWNPRDFTTDPYRRVDDRPYGGGPGMVMMPGPLRDCLDHVHRQREAAGRPRLAVIHLSPQGRRFDQSMAARLAQSDGCVLLCGRYEAVDQRLLDGWVDEEWSLGDFVVSGGELPALCVVDAAVRLLPGVLNDAGSAPNDSFADGLLDCPHYTRPETFDGHAVPAELLSGHHARIERWRRDRALEQTARRRPDLIAAARAAGRLDRADEALLRQFAPGPSPDAEGAAGTL